MKKRILTFIILLLCFQVYGQTYKLVSGSAPGESSIEFKWFTKNVNLDASFDIYRTETGLNNWKKVNENPIRRYVPWKQSEIEAMEAIKGKEAMLIYSSAMNDDSLDKKTSFSFLMLNAIMNNKLAEVCGIYFKDNTISASTNYDYKLTFAGSTSSIALQTNVSYKSQYIPESISNFTGKSGNKKAIFNWSYNQELPMYKVYRGVQSKKYDTSFIVFPSEDNTKSSASNKLSYEDNLANTKVGTTYYYAVSSLDFFERESAKSTEISIQILDLSRPPIVQGLRASYKEDFFIQISWRRPHKLVKSFKLFKSRMRASGYTEVLTGQDTFLIDKIIEEGQSYYYYMEAKSESGFSSYTDTVVCSTPDKTPPAVPVNVRATTDTGYIKLTWDANPEKDLKGYLVFRALSASEGNFTPLFADPIKENYFEDRHAKEVQNKIVYKICAMDQSYNRSAYTEPVYVKMKDMTAPDAPTIFETNYENRAVNLNWSRNSDLDFMKYEISRGIKINDSTFGEYSLLASSRETNYMDRSVTPNVDYSYLIRVVDSSNNKSDAASRLVYAKETKVLEVIQVIVAEKFDNAIKLAWSNSKMQEVQLFRKNDQSTFVPISDKITGNSWEDNDVIKGKVYYYKLISLGDEDDVSSDIVKVEF